MGKFILGLVIGLLIGGGGIYWYNRDGERKGVEVRAESDDLSRYGVIIKEKAKEAGTAIADATADARVTTTIKGKLTSELGAGSLANVSVSTSDGVVTLSGTVESEGEISKAVNAAYATDGVRKVFSTLQLKRQ